MDLMNKLNKKLSNRDKLHEKVWEFDWKLQKKTRKTGIVASLNSTFYVNSLSKEDLNRLVCN